MLLHRILILLALLTCTTTLPGQSSLRTGNDYAYFFYVTDFEPGWEDLPETREEVTAIARELEAQYGFQTEIIPNPSRQEILDQITQINNRSYGADDQVLFFFSMHGHFDRAADRGYLIPANGKIPNRDPYGQSWISYDDLGSYITKNPAEHVLLALDACYSGAFGDRYRGVPDAAPWEESGNCREKAQNALAHDSRLYFSSGSRDQRTPARSLFAGKWLEALRNGRQTGLVRFNDLRYFLSDINYPTPEGGSFTGRHEAGGDFVFLHQTACVASSKSPEPSEAEERLWRQAQRLDTREAYTFYLQAYPEGRFRQQAEARIAKLDLQGMVFVKGGAFQMGSTEGDSDETPVRRVTVSDFYMGRHEVTVEEFAEFIQATGYETNADKDGGSYVWNGEDWEKKAGVNWKDDAEGNVRPASQYDHPVIHVSWYDAVRYCNWRSEQDGLQPVYTMEGDEVSADWNADGYRLPTEAEWEFAARSRGKRYKYAWGDSDTPNGNIADEKAKEIFSGWTIWENYNDGYVYTAPVGRFEQGELGLFDMTGNVWEWCWDWYDSDYYRNRPSANPKGPDEGSGRVLRGGSWYDGPSDLRCANRYNVSPGDRSYGLGFRLSRAAR